MVIRQAQDRVLELAKSFKVIAVIGPRQAGKTTLVKSLFPNKPYASLENPDTRKFAIEDPRGFLSNFSNGAIFDEIQRTPELFSYLQEIIDNSTEKGKYILTGSNNFLLQENISQSLAGRVGYMTLLPFSYSELKQIKDFSDNETDILFNGCYPPVYDQKISPTDWYPNYIRTYIERDVRQIKNITDLIVFERFMRLCAGRTGQELNMNAISVEAGIDLKTVQSWIGILESSFILFLLKPHFQNFNKTVVKRPKLYFYDTGLVCSLLGINEANQLNNHFIKGSLFENYIVSELIKKRLNAGTQINLYYWRDKTGHEIDIIIDNAGELMPIEIKSGKTINTDYFKNIIYYNKLRNTDSGLVVYNGDQGQKRSNGIEVINWKEMDI
ncbi:MAG: superfamily protein [Daejeonella sp.]|nr:superfamily protein [Daejeonella sp.]